jgi:hypothetical protein
MSGVFEGTVPLEVAVDDAGRVVLKQKTDAGDQTVTLELGQAEHFFSWLQSYGNLS